jgi:hypothetical protein
VSWTLRRILALLRSHQVTIYVTVSHLFRYRAFVLLLQPHHRITPADRHSLLQIFRRVPCFQLFCILRAPFPTCALLPTHELCRSKGHLHHFVPPESPKAHFFRRQEQHRSRCAICLSCRHLLLSVRGLAARLEEIGPYKSSETAVKNFSNRLHIVAWEAQQDASDS